MSYKKTDINPKKTEFEPVYAPVAKYLLQSTDYKPLIAAYNLELTETQIKKYHATSIFFYFLDTEYILPDKGKIKDRIEQLTILRSSEPTNDQIRIYIDTLKLNMKNDLGATKQEKLYEWANTLYTDKEPDEPDFDKGIIYEALEQYRVIGDFLTDMALSLTHLMYYKKKGKKLERREGQHLEKCYKTAVSLMSDVNKKLISQLQEDYSISGIMEKLKGA